jgi:coniferyl-aldehyde dehydrogenase
MNLQTTFKLLHAASRAAPLTLAQRRSALKAISQALITHAAQACAMVDADFEGRHPDETRLLELAPSQQGLVHALKHLKSWAAPRRADVGLNFIPAQNRVIPQALGVVGIVVPWNYPIYLTIGPMTTALAAGNRVMIKVSEHTPKTGQWLADVLHAYLPADVCQVVQGGVDVAQAFCALPLDHLLFTGATALGPAVMGAAAQNLTPVTLELGGKSPAIVGAGADIAQAARRIAVGKWRHAGQTCIAPDYVLVQRSQYQTLVDALTAQAAKLYPDALNNPAYSSIINARQFNRLQAWAEEAAALGAVFHNQGALSDATRHRMAPAVVTRCPMNTKLMQDEIFGPLLPVLPYDTLDEAIAVVNAQARPLALYVFERSSADIAAVLARTTAGGVSVNETIVHIAQEDLPFGGVGASGMGHYHGRWGFDTFSKLKPVFYQSRFNGLGLLDPPHSGLFHKIVKHLTRT